MSDQETLDLEREVRETGIQEAGLKLARTYIRSGMYEKADNILTGLFLYDPENKEIILEYKGLAQEYSAAGKFEQAEEICQRLIQYNRADSSLAGYFIELSRVPPEEKEAAKRALDEANAQGLNVCFFSDFGSKTRNLIRNLPPLEPARSNTTYREFYSVRDIEFPKGSGAGLLLEGLFAGEPDFI